MAAPDNVHSRIIFWLKIILPLTALAILSTLFLFSRQIATEGTLPFAEVDVEDLARDQRLTAPEFSGLTEDGAAISVRATTARPGTDEGVASAEDLVAAYDVPGGLRIDLSAAQGVLDRTGGRMVLTGGVEIVTSSGYRVTTTGLDSALDRTELVSDGAIRAEAPYGTIDAGGMEISHSDAEVDGYVLVFNKGVKLIYEPVN